MTIELSFVTENCLASKAIRWFTHSDYSHIDIISPAGYRIGARADGGVRERKPNYAAFTRDDRLLIDVPDEAAGYKWLYAQLGKPYDSSGLYRSFVFSDYDWRTDDKWWCSELGMAFLENCGIKKCNIPANRIAPNDLYIYGWAFAK